jgi:hypothetical protein
MSTKGGKRRELEQEEIEFRGKDKEVGRIQNKLAGPRAICAITERGSDNRRERRFSKAPCLQQKHDQHDSNSA